MVNLTIISQIVLRITGPQYQKPLKAVYPKGVATEKSGVVLCDISMKATPEPNIFRD